MFNRSKRRSLSLLTAGMVAAAAPVSAWSYSQGLPNRAADNVDAFGASDKLSNVNVAVSTLGIGSAVTTITNKSNVSVTVTHFPESIIEHNNHRFDIGSAIGQAGVTLKPGQRRVLIAHRVRNALLVA